MTGRDQRWQHSSRCPNIFYALVAVSNAVIAVLELIRQYFD
ncbi:DinQ-like type I toxin DqlB [Klebsiella oxytoca]